MEPPVSSIIYCNNDHDQSKLSIRYLSDDSTIACILSSRFEGNVSEKNKISETKWYKKGRVENQKQPKQRR